MKKSLYTSMATLVFLGIASQANAGGLYLYEIGTEDPARPARLTEYIIS